MFGGRYIILLMGLFSIYTGLIYNDCFSKPLSLASSGWRLPDKHSDQIVNGVFDLVPYDRNESKVDFLHTYPFGIDPLWPLAENKITFTNSYKMKLSVVLGVLQMMFGVMLSYQNHSYFKNRVNIFCEFIPQVLFLGGIFGRCRWRGLRMGLHRLSIGPAPLTFSLATCPRHRLSLHSDHLQMGPQPL